MRVPAMLAVPGFPLDLLAFSEVFDATAIQLRPRGCQVTATCDSAAIAGDIVLLTGFAAGFARAIGPGAVAARVRRTT